MGLVIASVQQFDPGDATVVPGTPNIVPESEHAAIAAGYRQQVVTTA